MGKVCVVPKCKSGYRSCKEKVSIFRIPADKLERWKEIISRTDRELTCRDSICEKHFRKKDIIRKVKTPVYEYALQRPKLAPDAMPTRFSTRPKYELRARPNHQKNNLINPKNGLGIWSIKPELIKLIKYMTPKQQHKSLTDHEIDMKSKFMQKIQEDRKNFSRIRSFTTSRYNDLIDEIVRAKSLKSTKYRKRYDVVDIGGVKKLTAPFEKFKELRFYIADEELFDVIHEAHTVTNHAKAIRMFKELKKTFSNIKCSDILIYLELCLDCSSKKVITKFEKNSKPVTCYNAFSSKCHIDIIDYQPIPDGDYKFILVYQNDQTRFCILKALKSITLDEIYYNICDIFTFIGIPKIINSEICDESLHEIILRLRKRWPSFPITHIKSEGHNKLTERINEHVEAWMESKLSNEWSKGLRFIQLSINKDLDEEINQIPFESVFDVSDEKKMALEEIEIQKNCIKEEQIHQEELIIKEEDVEIADNICGTYL